MNPAHDPNPALEGHRLELAHDSGGLRHTLAGRPVHAGDALELRLPGGWLPGRYEWSFDPGTGAELHVALGGTDDGAVIRLPDSARLRWPR
jgi:hypothetical protein